MTHATWVTLRGTIMIQATRPHEWHSDSTIRLGSLTQTIWRCTTCSLTTHTAGEIPEVGLCPEVTQWVEDPQRTHTARHLAACGRRPTRPYQPDVVYPRGGGLYEPGYHWDRSVSMEGP